MKMMYTPVVLFAYNRPQHLERTLSALNNCVGVNNTELFVFSDYPKGETEKENVNKVRDLLNQFKNNRSLFSSVTIIKANHNKGLASSIIYGVTEIINKFGEAIVLEDDLIVSSDFLIYMNSALEYYRTQKSIWAISGYTFPMKALNNYPHNIYLALRGCSWGWGTWADRWNTVDWELTDYDEIKYNLKKRINFGNWGRDMPFMLDENYYGLNNSWAIRWCYAAFKQGKYTIYPKESRVMNIGADGSGVNYTSVIHKYDTKLIDGTNEVHFENVGPNKRIQREFRRRHKKFLGVIRDHYKWLLIKKGIIKVKNISKGAN